MKIKESKSKSLEQEIFLDISGTARKTVEFRKDEAIYCQGDPAKSVMYIQTGNVKFSVVNGSGKEAVVAMFGPNDFFGEGCMAGQPARTGTATAIAPTALLSIDKDELLNMLRTRHNLSNHFVEYMLSHNNRVEEDLIDQLFNSSEKRLARTLLVLGRYGKAQHQAEGELPNVTQEILAQIIGTTRSRVNFFMNNFRKLGFIEYHRHRIKINKSLLTFVLDE
ncbi:MAG TPA: Crp/Fnr family transcriptional regulator [Candidatus Acidoferrum sp.]|jgi:CRP/FNR family cyclic AMP-dependent transcriptional regulator|nr:Crp/Fnr family transcriptional regulator [Candidatus Acidoferrum sp.]